jgi:small-conductance mechanosensitive channel
MNPTPATDSFDDLLDYRFGLGGIHVSIGGIAAAALTVVVVWLLGRLVDRAFRRHAEQRSVRTRAAIYTISRLTQYSLYAIGFLLALGFLGIPTSRFAVVAGAIGVGLGFGLQAIFSNFVSGIILLFERSLRVGDFVELESGVHGEVRDINIRATLITTNDNIDILVPNSEFVSGRVVNWTHGDVARRGGGVTRRLHIPFGVEYGTDKELVKKAALEAAAEVPSTLELDGSRRPQVWLVNFGQNSLEFELVVWLTPDATKRPGVVKAGYLWALHTALCKYGIEIPYPQMDVHLRSLLGLSPEESRGLMATATAARDGAAAAGDQVGGDEAVPRTSRAPSKESPARIELAEHERVALSTNDACEEVARGAREDEERRAAEEAEAEVDAEEAVEQRR